MKRNARVLPDNAGQVRPAHDRRRSRRWKVFKEGRLILAGDRSVPCVIRDISEEGARLQVPSNTVLPEVFQLLVKPDDVVMSARRVWITLDQVGVRFIDP